MRGHVHRFGGVCSSIGSPGAGIRGGCKLPNAEAGNRTWILWKSSMYSLTDELSLQCVSLVLKNFIGLKMLRGKCIEL